MGVLRMARTFDAFPHFLFLPALQENPWREYKQVNEVLSATQLEHDERMVLTGRPVIPFNLGREQWFGYDRKSAWFGK